MNPIKLIFSNWPIWQVVSVVYVVSYIHIDLLKATALKGQHFEENLFNDDEGQGKEVL